MIMITEIRKTTKLLIMIVMITAVIMKTVATLIMLITAIITKSSEYYHGTLVSHSDADRKSDIR